MLLKKAIIIIVAFVLIAPVCFAVEPAQPASPEPAAPATPAVEDIATTGLVVTGDALPVSQPKVPYVAEVIGENVYVRSGPGTNYYPCIKVNSSQPIFVVGHEYGWSKILPPAGSFSWVSADFVKPDENNPDIGIVTGNAVRVRAGAPLVDPLHSASEQTKLNEGDQVKLLTKEKTDGYYKVIPPTGAHLWISSKYLKYIGPPDKVKPFKPEPKKPEPVKPVVVIKPPKPEVVVPTKVSRESKLITQCRQLRTMMQAELKKPAEKQNYTAIKTALEKIVADPDADKSKRYAKYQLALVAQFELAIDASRQLKKQDSALLRARAKIKDAHDKKIAKIPNPGKFIAMGKLRESSIYTVHTGQKRYLLIGDAGKIICYAVPAEDAAPIDPAKFLNHQVGLVGTATSDKRNSISLVKFTELVDLTPEPAAK